MKVLGASESYFRYTIVTTCPKGKPESWFSLHPADRLVFVTGSSACKANNKYLYTCRALLIYQRLLYS